MIGWIARIIFSLAAVVAGWFVARDSANFSIVQLAVGLLLAAAFVAVAAFAPRLFSRFGKRRP